MSIWVYYTSDGLKVAVDGEDPPEEGEVVAYVDRTGRTINMEAWGSWEEFQAIPEGAVMANRGLMQPKRGK